MEILGVHTYKTLTYSVVCFTTVSTLYGFSYKMVLRGVNFEINEAVFNNFGSVPKIPKLLMSWPNI